MEKNLVFFLYTNFTDVSCGIVRCSSFYNIPSNCVWCIDSLQIVDVSAKTSSFDFWMFHVITVVVLSALHCLGSGPCICFHLVSVSPGDSGFVYHIVNQATNSRKNLAGFRFLRSARATATKCFLGCCSIFTIQNFVLVLGDFLLDVGHAPVTQFKGVSVANFVQYVSWRESLFQNGKELGTNVALDIAAPWGVKPSYISILSFAFLRPAPLPSTGIKSKFVVIFTGIKSNGFALKIRRI